MAETPAGKTGLVYIARIPPYMKSHKLRYILSTHGSVKRMYLRKEPMWIYKKRLEGGGRKGRLYKDGWAEFEFKKDAKECERAMNAKMTGLKGRWQDDIWAVKYLTGFKWNHLEEELEKERRSNLTNFNEETEKAKEIAKKWLKQTKANVMTRKGASKSSKKRTEEEDDADFSDGTGVHQDDTEDEE